MNFNKLLQKLRAGRFMSTLFNLKVEGHDRGMVTPLPPKNAQTADWLTPGIAAVHKIRACRYSPVY